MAERGVPIDHSNIYRWVQKFTPQLEAAFRKGRKRPVGHSWRMDETYIKIKGKWRYLYRAVDRDGQTIDFLLTAHRDKKAAVRFLKKAVRQVLLRCFLTAKVTHSLGGVRLPRNRTGLQPIVPVRRRQPSGLS